MIHSIALRSRTQPPVKGVEAPSTNGFDVPFEMLAACHERVLRTLDLLESLRRHMHLHGFDANASDAIRDVMRFFDLAGPLHHEDEELHVFPVLLAHQKARLGAVIRQLQQDHRDMEDTWAGVRAVLVRAQEAGRETRNPVLTAADDLAFARFADLYGDHIRTEESLVYPASLERLGVHDLGVMGADMMRRRRP